MHKELLEKLSKVDKKVFLVMNKGFIFAEILAVIGIIMLYLYNKFYISHDLYLSSLIVFKTSILTAISFVVCGLTVDEIKKQLR